MVTSIDKIADAFLPSPDIGDGVGYKPDQAVVDCERYINPASNDLTVIVPPWHASKFVQNRLIKRQRDIGKSVLAYTLHDDMLTANPDMTVASFEAIGERIAQDMSEIDVPRKRLVGISLGTAVVPFVLGEHKIAARATLITPGGDLAKSLWTGIRTQHLRRAFEAQGLDLMQLQWLWQRLSPTYQATNNIRGCDFTWFASTSDLVIRPDTLSAYYDALRENNTVEVRANRYLGHYGTILRRCLIGKV